MLSLWQPCFVIIAHKLALAPPGHNIKHVILTQLLNRLVESFPALSEGTSQVKTQPTPISNSTTTSVSLLGQHCSRKDRISGQQDSPKHSNERTRCWSWNDRRAAQFPYLNRQVYVGWTGQKDESKATYKWSTLQKEYWDQLSTVFLFCLVCLFATSIINYEI